MNSLEIHITKLEETARLGTLIGNIAIPGDIICLDGSLGAGKTALSQQIAKGLEVPPECYVTSPSFAILHEYQGRLPMFHMDFYRLESSDDVIDLGFEEYMYRDGVTVIEWAERAEDILPPERLVVFIVLNKDQSRDILIKGGQNYMRYLHAIADEFEIGEQ